MMAGFAICTPFFLYSTFGWMSHSSSVMTSNLCHEHIISLVQVVALVLHSLQYITKSCMHVFIPYSTEKEKGKFLFISDSPTKIESRRRDCIGMQLRDRLLRVWCGLALLCHCITGLSPLSSDAATSSLG